MNIELGQLPDGNLVLMNNGAFPHDIRRIEYYKDQKLVMLVYNAANHEGDLMHYELKSKSDLAIKSTPSILVIENGANQKMYGYDVPLIQVGI